MAKRKRAQNIRTVIKNYGLMWRRDSVFWSTRNANGILNGQKSFRKINFCDQIGVYVLYDEARRPIYVGQTGQGKSRLFARLRSHRRDNLAHRWHYLSWFGMLKVNKNGTLSGWDYPSKRVFGTIQSMLNEIEGVLIAATEPPFNKQGARFRGIEPYRQVADPRAEYVPSAKLRELLTDITQQIDDLHDRIA
ncbi:MAG: GIY-YIG nuclease family protein [Alphaproteobacteria bacterium]